MIHAVWEAEEVNPTCHPQPLEWAPPGNPTTFPLQTEGSPVIPVVFHFSLACHPQQTCNTVGIPPTEFSYIALSFPYKSTWMF